MSTGSCSEGPGSSTSTDSMLEPVFNFALFTRSLKTSSASGTAHKAIYTQDILLHIFNFCLPSNLAHAKGISPLNLAQVCRTWRELTFSTESLWSRIKIKPPRGGVSDKEFKRVLKRCGFWIQKSAGGPLFLDCDFTWNENSNKRPLDAGKILQIIDELFEEQGRLPTSKATHLVPSRLLELKISEMFNNNMDESFNLDVSNALNIRRLEVAAPIELTLSGQRFSSLRVLSLATLGRRTLGRIVTLLESAPNLEQIKIAASLEVYHIDLPHDAEAEHKRYIQLRNLRSIELEIKGTWSGVCGYILNRLEAPALQILSFQCVVDHMSIWKSLSSFINESKMDLKAVHIACLHEFYSDVPRDTQVMSVLELLPTVEFLSLRGIFMTSLLTHAMDVNLRHEAAILPKLQVLYLAHHTLDGNDFGGLSDALSSRCTSDCSETKLKRVLIDYVGGPRRPKNLQEMIQNERNLPISMANEKTIMREFENAKESLLELLL